MHSQGRTVTVRPEPAWLTAWPVAYPHPTRSWTVRNGNRWGRLQPETGKAVELQPRVDRELPGLAPALVEGSLISYRIGRRAVVGTADRYVKIVRPRRAARLAATHQHLADQRMSLGTPTLRQATEDGRLILSPRRGRSLHQLLRAEADAARLVPVISRVAEGLAEFHEMSLAPLAEALPVDRPDHWMAVASRAEPHRSDELTAVAVRLPPVPTVSRLSEVMTHRDLNDKSFFVSADQVGLIDPDGLTIGAPEDDLANLAVHLRLRALQGRRDEGFGHRLAGTLYRSYETHRALDHGRLIALQRHTWFRLAVIHHYRRASRHLTSELLRLAAEDR